MSFGFDVIWRMEKNTFSTSLYLKSLLFGLFLSTIIFRRNVYLQAYNSAVIRDITVTPTKGNINVSFGFYIFTYFYFQQIKLGSGKPNGS